jgi:hypothetical protein
MDLSGNISSYKVSDKPGKSTLNVGQIWNMDSKGESSKTSSVKNIDGTYVDSVSYHKYKSDKNPRKLPHPFWGRDVFGDVAKFKMGLDLFGKDIPVNMEPIKNIADSPDALTKLIPRLNGLNTPIKLPENTIAPTLYNRNNATGAFTDYGADLKELRRKPGYSRIIVERRRS